MHHNYSPPQFRPDSSGGGAYDALLDPQVDCMPTCNMLSNNSGLFKGVITMPDSIQLNQPVLGNTRELMIFSHFHTSHWLPYRTVKTVP